MDIIKSGGYKLSALDIEKTLLSHPDIVDCAVVGVNDITWGQKVAALLVLDSPDKTLNVDDVKVWAKDKMADYKIPRVVKVVHKMPRNVMGKVNKKNIVETEFRKYKYS